MLQYLLLSCVSCVVLIYTWAFTSTPKETDWEIGIPQFRQWYLTLILLAVDDIC